MKRLSPQKRNQLIGVALATAGLICGVYFMLIAPRNQKNAELEGSISKAQTRLQEMKNIIKQKEAAALALDNALQQLSQQEEDVASGDPAAWTFDTMRQFKANYHVDIPSIGQPTLGDCDIIGNFPYKQIRFSVAGSAYYHDLGKFVADFENRYPHCRVLNLFLEPAETGPAAGERLSFRMDIIALVKANN